MDNIEIKTEPVDYIVEEDALIPEIKLEEREPELEQNGIQLQCPKCQISYNNKYSYRNHVSVCDRYSFNRPLSKEEVSKSEAVREENKRSVEVLEESCFRECSPIRKAVLPKEAQYSCPECDRLFVNECDYARHTYAHTFIKVEDEDFPHMCADCGKDFDTLALAISHQNRQSNKRCKNYPKLVHKCRLCNMFFTRKDNLRGHLKTHALGQHCKQTKKAPGLYPCSKCPKVFGGTSLRAIHMRSHNRHTGSYDYACLKCKKTFSCSQSLKKHNSSHHGKWELMIVMS